MSTSNAKNKTEMKRRMLDGIEGVIGDTKRERARGGGGGDGG